MRKYNLAKTVLFIFFTLLVVCLTYVVSNAQDSTAVNNWSPIDLIPANIKKWLLIIYAAYEGIVLLLPSTRNASLVGNILKWISGGGNRAK